MSEHDDPGCLGLCDIDWEQGLCLSCGRSTDEMYGTPDEDTQPVPAGDSAQ